MQSYHVEYDSCRVNLISFLEDERHVWCWSEQRQQRWAIFRCTAVTRATRCYIWRSTHLMRGNSIPRSVYFPDTPVQSQHRVTFISSLKRASGGVLRGRGRCCTKIKRRPASGLFTRASINTGIVKRQICHYISTISTRQNEIRLNLAVENDEGEFFFFFFSQFTVASISTQLIFFSWCRDSSL